MRGGRAAQGSRELSEIAIVYSDKRAETTRAIKSVVVGQDISNLLAIRRIKFVDHKPLSLSVDRLERGRQIINRQPVDSARHLRLFYWVAELCEDVSAQLRAVQLEAACKEETDHLAWTRQRLDELGARPSLLNPLWYAGAFGLGLLAGRFGPGVSLGFVVETERQVEAHLASHMERLPPGDQASRAIVAQMKDDEARHAREAQHAGATELPEPVRGLMRLAARVMTTVAHRI